MNPELEMLHREKSRDRWLASSAAFKLACGQRISEVPTEELETLAHQISQELQDRDLREVKAATNPLPF